MVAALIASTVDDVAKFTAIATMVGAVLTFAGLLVRQNAVSTKMTSEQSDKWQLMLTVAEHRAELAEKRADACETRASAAERKAGQAEGRADLLELQLDEVRRQLETLRQQIAAADLLPKREPPT